MSNRRWTISLFIFFFFMVSCATRPPERAVPLTVVVGPVTFEAPVTTSTQIYTFDQEPDRDLDRQLLPTLINDIEVTAQRVLTEELAKQPGIRVIPFDETRRLLADIAPAGQPFTDAQVQSLGQQIGADHVVTGLIHDYGAVRWQYWSTGWLAHVAVATTIVGFATAWNPAAIGAYLAVDATTDFPLWYGGAEIFGWALRPVRVHLDITQIKPCSGEIWSHDELIVKVPGKRLAQYPEDQQHLKQVQLDANLHKALDDVTAEAGDILEIRPCREDAWQCSCLSSLSMPTPVYYHSSRSQWTARPPLSSRCGRHVMLSSSWDHSLTLPLARNCPSSRCWNLRPLLNCLLPYSLFSNRNTLHAGPTLQFISRSQPPF